jgi:hypothetical protein
VAIKEYRAGRDCIWGHQWQRMGSNDAVSHYVRAFSRFEHAVSTMPGEGEEARLDGFPDFGVTSVPQGLPDNRLHRGKGIFHAMIQFADEHPGLGLFLLVIGKVDEGGKMLNARKGAVVRDPAGISLRRQSPRPGCRPTV